jgi:3-oxoadipate enol-lactonase
MFYKTHDHQNLYYEIHGNLESDKAIIFLNGLSQSTVAWYFMLPSFTTDYKVILCDLIFQGQSHKGGEMRDFDQHAFDIQGLVDSLNIKKINVAGISYGSLVAQHMALNHPEKIDKLILMSTFANSTPYTEAISVAWSSALNMGGYAHMFDVMLPTVLSENYFLNPLIPIDTLKIAKQTTNTDATALKKLMQATAERPDYREKIKAIKVPTMVIQGEQDVLFPVHMAKEVSDAIQGSKLEVIKGVGHTLNLEAVPQTTELILDFTK